VLKKVQTGFAALIVIAAPAVLFPWVIKPYRCNLAKKRANNALRVIETLDTHDFRVAQLARANIDLLQSKCNCCDEDTSRAMALAASYRFLGLNQRAEIIYTQALRYDRRPELYFNLGQTQIDGGNVREGVRNLITACIYNPAYLDEIGTHHPEVLRAVSAYQRQFAASQRDR